MRAAPRCPRRRFDSAPTSMPIRQFPSPRRRFLGAALAAALAACAGSPHSPVSGTDPAPPPAPPSPLPPSPLPPTERPPLPPLPQVAREFRGVWIATVANIDWPSKPGLPAAEQQAEALALLNKVQALGLNAVVLQVRPAADALYPSSLEPWSEFLTGQQGRAPAPLYDPLEFWIAEAHRRGLELHAWINPYRARHSAAKSEPAPNHVARRLPHAVKSYGEQLWLDPAQPDALAHTLAVVADLVRRYDIDGLHFDDYFYPYPVKARGAKVGAGETALDGPDLEFPDHEAWRAYRALGGSLDRADWRRDQVNALVELIQRTAREIKPWVKLGISPFGLGRPDRRPAGIVGFSQYDQLYADVEHWLAQGWLDYLAPQLYWPIRQSAQAFGVLHEYWLRQNPQGRAIWPGLFASQVGAAQKSWAADEIVEQVLMTRQQNPGAGHLLYSMAPLLQDRGGLATKLAPLYAAPALPPTMPWLGLPVPARPALKRIDQAAEWAAATEAAGWVAHRLRDGRWDTSLLPATTTRLAWPQGDTAIAVAAVNRAGVIGDFAVLRAD